MSAILGGSRGAAALVAACVIFAGTAEGHAQEPPFDGAIDLQLFDYATGPKSFLSVASADVVPKGQFSVDMLLTFLTEPFTIFNYDANQEDLAGERTSVVDQIFAGQLVGAYGLADKLQLGLVLPMIFSMSGDGVDPASGTMSPDGVQATGLGDLRVEIKGLALERDPIKVAWWGAASVPTSYGTDGNDFLGDNLPTARGGGAVQWTDKTGKLTAGANLGVILRKPRTVYASEVGQQLTYGAAGAFKATDRFSVIAELFGRTGLTAIDVDASPLEAGGGLRLKASKSISVTVGGGAGLVHGIGSPGLRALASVGYAPDFRDTDGDGIPNQRDQCALLPEDRDGFEDNDGCPDDDNDGDKREDAEDQCPNDKEDLDGFEDDDGCPEDDNDKDGFKDFDDRCPTDPEDGIKPFDTDGCPASKRDSDDDGVSDARDQCSGEMEDFDEFEDWDGCPEADNDRDGLPDEDDKCPLCPEDADGFKDDDGCPDLDNDRDGLADRVDQCPDEAETLNGISDEDGCPDRGTEIAKLDGNRIAISAEIRFSGSDVLRSRNEVDVVAKIMLAHTEVAKWRIVAAARKQKSDEATREKSQRQAEAVKARLVESGVPADSIEALGAVSDNTIVAIAVIERRSEDDEEFLCPAEARVTPRAEPPEPAPSAAPAAAPESAPGATRAAPVAPAAAKPAAAAAKPAAAKPAAAKPTATPAPAASGGAVPDEFAKYSGVVSEVRFKRDKTDMAGRTTKVLDEIAALMAEHPSVHLEVGAHTDHRKGPEKTREISQGQADAVVAHLTSKGIDASRLTAVGYGMDKPIGDNNTSKGRAANRRIEFTFSTR